MVRKKMDQALTNLIIAFKNKFVFQKVVTSR